MALLLIFFIILIIITCCFFCKVLCCCAKSNHKENIKYNNKYYHQKWEQNKLLDDTFDCDELSDHQIDNIEFTAADTNDEHVSLIQPMSLTSFNYKEEDHNQYMDILNILSSELIIFCNDIKLIIAEYCIGKIKMCSYKSCDTEVLILSHHKSIGHVDNYRYDRKFGIKYFYDKNSDFMSCSQHINKMIKCRGYKTANCIGNKCIDCNQYLFTDDNINCMYQMTLCGCGENILCRNNRKKHAKCNSCNILFCREWIDDDLDWCDYRYCSFCFRKGCNQCIPVHEAWHDCIGRFSRWDLIYKNSPEGYRIIYYKCRNQCRWISVLWSWAVRGIAVQDKILLHYDQYKKYL
eukprot:316505_1